MVTDFDTPTDRSGSNAEKWDRAGLREYFGRDDLLPFWVADMEFRAPPVVIAGLSERAAEGIFGYEKRPAGVVDAFREWQRIRHGWNVDSEQICFNPGVLSAIGAFISLCTEEGDSIIVQPPVFFEFRVAIRGMGRKMVTNPLVRADAQYEIDFDDLEKKAADPTAKMLILCSPHNPVGRVWTANELERLGAICHRHGVFILSDEIHGDILYSRSQHRPFLSVVSPEIGQNSAACLSPAKTFNIASVTEAASVIPNPALRRRFEQYFARHLISGPAAFSSVAMECAYRSGGPWLNELLAYLQGNIVYMRAFLEAEVPGVQLVEPQGTYLAWLDLRGLGLETKDLARFLVEHARLALNPGYWFGRQGAGYARMTIACPRPMLEEGLGRLASAVKGLGR